MDTNDLIELLSKDTSRPWRFRNVMVFAVFGGILVAGALFFVGIGVRPDIHQAMSYPRFLFKFVITTALAVTATAAALRLGSPENRVGLAGISLAVAPGLLIVAAAVELMLLPENQWMSHMIGHNARFCLTLIPLLAAGPLTILLVAFRRGAPANPGVAGAIAGLLASGIAATFYAANCNDDSPLFVMAWYPIAILMVTTIGWAAGRRFLRW